MTTSGSVLSGRELAGQIRARVAERVAGAVSAGHRPALAVVSATENEASRWYVRSIAKAAATVGIECHPVELGPVAGPGRITAALARLSADDRTLWTPPRPTLAPLAAAETLLPRTRAVPARGDPAFPERGGSRRPIPEPEREVPAGPPAAGRGFRGDGPADVGWRYPVRLRRMAVNSSVAPRGGAAAEDNTVNVPI